MAVVTAVFAGGIRAVRVVARRRIVFRRVTETAVVGEGFLGVVRAAIAERVSAAVRLALGLGGALGLGLDRRRALRSALAPVAK